MLVRPDGIGILFEAVLKVAALAGVEEVAAAFEDLGDVAGLGCFVDSSTGFAEGAGTFHPRAGILRSTFHHEQVAGFGEDGGAGFDG